MHDHPPAPGGGSDRTEQEDKTIEDLEKRAWATQNKRDRAVKAWTRYVRKGHPLVSDDNKAFIRDHPSEAQRIRHESGDIGHEQAVRLAEMTHLINTPEES